jgi:Tfp pilus assembly protein PilX
MAEQIITLITGLLGLIPTAIAAYFAIKNFIAVTKEKSSKEIWALIMSLADAAMKEAEQSLQDGETKKQMVIDSVKAGCKSAGVDLDMFIDQLSDYIDDTIDFVNCMNNKK